MNPNYDVSTVAEQVVDAGTSSQPKLAGYRQQRGTAPTGTGFDRSLLPDPQAYFEAKGLTLQGRGKMRTTSCVLHGGSDSMRINLEHGWWKCMNCEAKGGNVLDYELQSTGAEFIDAVKALGCWVDDGRPQQVYKPTPLSPRQALSVLSFEATFTAIAAANVGHGYALTQVDLDRLITAANRITNIAEAFK